MSGITAMLCGDDGGEPGTNEETASRDHDLDAATQRKTEANSGIYSPGRLLCFFLSFFFVTIPVNLVPTDQ